MKQAIYLRVTQKLNIPLHKQAFLILASSLLLAGCSSTLTSRKELVFQEVYYVTTRNETGLDEPGRRFGGERGETRFGVSMLAIDQASTFGSFARAQPNRTLQQDELFRSQPLQQVVSLGENDFLDALEAYADAGQPHPPILIYIHGYMKSFRRASTIAAQLRYELAFPGPVIAFSWPSTNNVSGYMADLENLTWSEPELRRFINLLIERFPTSPIHIIAHSMGNQALINVLEDLYRSCPSLDDWSIGEIVLIAPDIDRDIFIRDTASRLRGIPSRKTLYVSAKDFPLFASATVYQYPRLGDSRKGTPVVEGIDTIDVSDAIPLFDGHGYYETNRETIEDLYYLIRMGLGAGERPNLKAEESAGGMHWRLKPVEEMQ